MSEGLHSVSSNHEKVRNAVRVLRVGGFLRVSRCSMHIFEMCPHRSCVACSARFKKDVKLMRLVAETRDTLRRPRGNLMRYTERKKKLLYEQCMRCAVPPLRVPYYQYLWCRFALRERSHAAWQRRRTALVCFCCLHCDSPAMTIKQLSLRQHLEASLWKHNCSLMNQLEL